MHSRLRVLSTLALCIALGTGCGSDKSTNPKDDGGGGGGGGSTQANQFADGIKSFTDQYYAANAAAYASLEYFGPYIYASLGLPAPPAPARALTAQASCFAGVDGTTYVFNGEAYVAGEISDAPPNSVRYVLYRLDTLGAPDLADSIGYLEIRCEIPDGSIVRNVGATLVANGVLVLDMSGYVSEGTGTLVINGILGASGRTPVEIQIAGSFSPDLVDISTNFFPPGIQLQAGTVDDLLTGARTRGVSVFWFAQETIEWEVLLRLEADAASETISEGALYYGLTSQGSPQLVACASGGTLAQPVFTAPNASCDVLGYGVGTPLSTESLALIASGYQRLEGVHTTLVDLVRRAFGISSTVS